MPEPCDDLMTVVLSEITSRLRTRPGRDGGCILTLPFRDDHGDPMRIAVRQSGELYELHDLGVLAGSLFSLDQHSVETPAFQLLQELANIHNLHLDFDSGIVRLMVHQTDLYEGIMSLTKTLITVLSALPHIQIAMPNPAPRGQRVRTKIKGLYQQLDILRYVQPNFHLDGSGTHKWPVDFRWWVEENNHRSNIYIVSVDLNTATPIQKASNVMTMVMDAKRIGQYDRLRLVVDRHGNNQVSNAIEIMRGHAQEFQYDVFVFDDQADQLRLAEISASEVKGPLGDSWRDFWLSSTSDLSSFWETNVAQ